MEFIIGLLNFVGFIFYIIAAIASFGTLIFFMLVDSKDGGGIKIGLIAAVAAIFFGSGGYFIRDYANTLKRSKNFTESLTNGDKEKVKWRRQRLAQTTRWIQRASTSLKMMKAITLLIMLNSSTRQW